MTDLRPGSSTDAEQDPLSRVHGIVFLVTGAALVIHILLPVPLPLSVVATMVVAWTVIWAVSRDTALIGQYRGSTLVRTGLVAAVPALLAYDLSRLLVSETVGMSVGPFDAFPHFGSALIGQGAPETLRVIVGTGFHITNGVAFAVAFAIIFRAKGVVVGIGWGLFLEVMMLGVYPAWLQIEQLGEFVQLSIVGHVCYGSTLGYLCKRRLTARV